MDRGGTDEAKGGTHPISSALVESKLQAIAFAEHYPHSPPPAPDTLLILCFLPPFLSLNLSSSFAVTLLPLYESLIWLIVYYDRQIGYPSFLNCLVKI